MNGSSGSQSPPSGAITHSSLKFPKSLAWYQEGIKWLVTTAAAALIIGYGFASNDHQALLGFTIAGILLLCAMLAGMLCTFWITEFARGWETSNRPRQDKALHRMTIGYHITLGTFLLGMAALVADTGYRLWTTEHATPPHYNMTTDRTGAITVIDTTTGTLWQRQETTPGTYTWKQITSPMKP